MLSPIDEIKSRLDIVDVISEYLPLKPAGVNHKALCPFHQEKTPSFMVHREKQIWHCFGCGEGGDIFTFIQKIESLEFPESLRLLAKKAGVRLPQRDPQLENLKTKLLDIHHWATIFYQQNLEAAAGQNVLVYLKEERGLLAETIKSWQIGLAPDNWQAGVNFLKTKGFSEEEIVTSGLGVRKNNRIYDRFRGRIMFPLRDIHGQVIGFTGRSLPGKEGAAKYLNSPQTPIFDKGKYLYGLDLAKSAIREENRTILVEGNLDAILSHQSGVTETVATSGTSLTKNQLLLLRRYTDKIIVAFDIDPAGQLAIERGLGEILKLDFEVKVAIMPAELGKDPAEIINKEPAIWPKLLGGAIPFMDYIFQRAFDQFDAASVAGQKKIAHLISEWLWRLVDPIEQDYYIRQLSNKLGVSEVGVRELVNRYKPGARQQARETIIEPPILAQRNINLALERLLALSIKQPKYLSLLNQEVKEEYLPLPYRHLYGEILLKYSRNEKISFAELTTALPKEAAKLIDRLNLLAEDEFDAISEKQAGREVKQLIKLIKKDYITNTLRKLEAEIKRLEEKSQTADSRVRHKLDTLLSEFTAYTNELAKLEN